MLGCPAGNVVKGWDQRVVTPTPNAKWVMKPLTNDGLRPAISEGWKFTVGVALRFPSCQAQLENPMTDPFMGILHKVGPLFLRSLGVTTPINLLIQWVSGVKNDPYLIGVC